MYKCKYCLRSYVWKQSLKRHVQQSHWDEASDEYDETNADMSDDSNHAQQSDVDDVILRFFVSSYSGFAIWKKSLMKRL